MWCLSSEDAVGKRGKGIKIKRDEAVEGEIFQWMGNIEQRYGGGIGEWEERDEERVNIGPWSSMLDARRLLVKRKEV